MLEKESVVVSEYNALPMFQQSQSQGGRDDKFGPFFVEVVEGRCRNRRGVLETKTVVAPSKMSLNASCWSWVIMKV
ncbi:hypothetical protein FRX31_025186 [Thalictrum thalictroides]|uniref:Uncharacterized protein n=1 Tax=Thalictrum thalictroides TaxID=46969 RepID=A0A7J6VKE6_THATH|nr:hypothetical protein FRX31_025186 [Thalictrum thalictroides]